MPGWLLPALSRIADRERLATLEEQREAVSMLAATHGSKLHRRMLGRSAEGRSIELLTVGQGGKSILVVGGPHPNEPVGGVSILSLLGLLLGDEALCQNTGSTWHFIHCIDPDGLARNARWIQRPLSLTSYLDDYFRPAFHQQPEYTFPLAGSGFGADRSTPENVVWQRALELTRPSLQVSLHNADIGGAFFLLSERHAGLSKQLVTLAAARSIEISSFGEPLADLEPFDRGVFAFPDIGAMARAASSPTEPGVWGWTAGDSSAGFGRRMGTQSLVPEVPLWNATPLEFNGKDPSNLGGLLVGYLECARELSRMLDRHTGSVTSSVRPEDAPWSHSVLEGRQHAAHQVAMIDKLLQSEARALATTFASVDACMMSLQLRLFLLRSAATLRALARRRGFVQVVDECDEFIQRGVSWMEATARIEPARIADLAAVQVGAALLAAVA